MPVATLTIPYPDDISQEMDALLEAAKTYHLLLAVRHVGGKKLAVLSGRPEYVVLAARRMQRRPDEIDLVHD